MEEQTKNIFDDVRFFVNLIYRTIGVGVWAFLCILMFRFYILNMPKSLF